MTLQRPRDVIDHGRARGTSAASAAWLGGVRYGYVDVRLVRRTMTVHASRRSAALGVALGSIALAATACGSSGSTTTTAGTTTPSAGTQPGHAAAGMVGTLTVTG